VVGRLDAAGPRRWSSTKRLMRIVAGEFRGRRLRAPGDRHARPTADRVREAWCSILGDRLVGARVLDLWAGSGALGLEALSRGAVHAEFVERGRTSLLVLRKNVATLDVEDRVTIVRGDALRHVREIPQGAFDIAFADPPYDTDGALQLTQAFRARPFADILGVEHRGPEDVEGDETRRYGDAALTFCFAP
jgi:16S rRNA (guanine966-N2)-methyltransferase